MKIKKELIAIMVRKNKFVEKYKNKGSLAYESEVGSIEHAAVVPFEFYELQKEKYEHMAEMLGGQLVKIEAEYEIKTIDDEEPEIVKETGDELDQALGKAFSKFMASKLGGLD